MLEQVERRAGSATTARMTGPQSRTGMPRLKPRKPGGIRVLRRSTISSRCTGLRRDEVVTLADIGALNSFGYDRRSALWQAERAVRRRFRRAVREPVAGGGRSGTWRPDSRDGHACMTGVSDHVLAQAQCR